MARQQISLKQLAIDKDNTRIALAVGLAAFVVVFSLVASNALIKQSAYQSKVISKKKEALAMLQKNKKEVESLKTSYQAFADQQENVLEGKAEGTGPMDGENPRLVLDALPSKYDFPALATSLEKVFTGYALDSITGTDDEIAQAAAPASNAPQPVDVPFAITFGANASTLKTALEQMEKSIRPIQVQKLRVEGSQASLKVSVNAKTYFQPQKIFDVKKEKVK